MKKLFIVSVAIVLIFPINAMDTNNVSSDRLKLLEEKAEKGGAVAIGELALDAAKKNEYEKTLTLYHRWKIRAEQDKACCKDVETEDAGKEICEFTTQFLYTTPQGEVPYGADYLDYRKSLSKEEVNKNMLEQCSWAESLKQEDMWMKQWKFAQLKPKEEWQVARQEVIENIRKKIADEKK